MAGKSSIKTKLSDEDRAELDRLLGADRHTLDELVAILTDGGYEISRSALHRYSQEYSEIAEKIKATREAAMQIANDLGAIADSKQGLLLVELMQTMLFRAATGSLGEDNPDSAEDLMLMARALKDITSAQKGAADLQISLRKQIAAEAVERVEKVGATRGLTADTIAAVKAEILGIAQ